MAPDHIREKIVAHAAQQFFTYGYSKVSTEDLASGLAMSKSTLYKYFPRKADLLDAAVDSFSEAQAAIIDKIFQNRQLTIQQKIESYLSTVISRLAVFKAEAAQDIKRARPEVYARLMEIRKKAILEKLIQLFQEGVQRGYFRKDMDPGFVVTILLAAIEAVGRPDYLMHSSYTYDTVLEQSFKLIMEGCLPR